MTTQQIKTQPWHWDLDRVREVIGTRNAMRAMGGKPCPVAASVLEKLEKVGE